MKKGSGFLPEPLSRDNLKRGSVRSVSDHGILPFFNDVGLVGASIVEVVVHQRDGAQGLQTHRRNITADRAASVILILGFLAFGAQGIFDKQLGQLKILAVLDDRDAIQYLSDSLLGMNNVAYTTFPQFERKAYAAHVAVGSMKNYVDLSLLHAADDLNSLPSQWYMINMLSSDASDTLLVVRDSTIKGKENLAMGLKGHFTFGKHVLFETNLGASFFTPDITREEIVIDGGDAELANRVLNGVRNTGLFNVRYGSEVRFAGDALLNLNIRPVRATFTYRFVQPDYTSLGANGFNQNAQTYGTNISSSLFNNTAFLSLNGYLQRDNLDKKQLFTNQVGSYTVSWSNFFNENIGLAVMYNGVTQKQFDGAMEVPDEIRINQITHSFDLSPSYTLSLDNDHTFSLEFNLLQNKNQIGRAHV